MRRMNLSRRLGFMAIVALALGCFSSVAQAGLFGCCGGGAGRGLFGGRFRQNYTYSSYSQQTYTYQYHRNVQPPTFQVPAPTYYYYPTYPARPALPSCGPQGCPQVSPFSGEVVPQHGFLGMLNSIRARYGLRALIHDQSLTNAAHQNNYAQASYGVGHHVNPGVQQCAFVGPRDESSALNGWLNSPSHAQILLNPNVTRIGLAGELGCWTANLY